MKKLKKLIGGLRKGFEEFGKNISLIINSVLLAIVYILAVGITSIIAKLIGKKFLNIKRMKGNTYWTNLDLRKKSIESYYRQF